MDTSMGYNSSPVALRDIIGRNRDDTIGDPPTCREADSGSSKAQKNRRSSDYQNLLIDHEPSVC
jgi:hypothetical protein